MQFTFKYLPNECTCSSVAISKFHLYIHSNAVCQLSMLMYAVCAHSLYIVLLIGMYSCATVLQLLLYSLYKGDTLCVIPLFTYCMYNNTPL